MQPRTSSAGHDAGRVGSPVALYLLRAGWCPIERLGAGGSAEVWRAVDKAGREAAVKIVKPELGRDADAAAWLRREHEWLARLTHRHVVRPLDLIEHDGSAALAIEYLPGGDLVPLVGSHPRHWLAALRGVLAALRHLHEQGFAHGDLKARNVLFGADGRPKLIDFASLRPLLAPTLSGGNTAAYAPAAPLAVARDADCFAFAALLFELATSRLPYGAVGARYDGEPPCDVHVTAAAGPFVAAAVDALMAGGRVPGGLLAFTDVIESAVVT
jgi:serine/threonine protein kinase